VFVPLPFNPDEVWPPKPVHHVTGTINGHRLRAVIELIDGRPAVVLGPAWRRDCGVAFGDSVEVSLSPEGTQRADLPLDLAAALAANPEAGAFFDGLAQFYVKAYLRWIDATKRRPDLRATRIAEVVTLLAAGVKQRP
jgi:hypothetical protein